MTTQTKHLQFKGIEKKEQILFKSFLNLAKNELEYQIVISKSDRDAPDMLIVDDKYEFLEDEQNLKDLPAITIGEDIEAIFPCYIARPVQWSDFKRALSMLVIDPSDADAAQVLPEEMKFHIEPDDSVPDEEQKARESDQKDYVERDDPDGDDDYDYDYELGNMSADYYSFTNSDYVKVADDVQGFKEDKDEDSNDPVILMTDDESASANSVLVLETNSFDAWDYSESEISVATFEDFDDPSVDPDESSTQIIAKPPRRKGIEVDQDEEYWAEDNEIIVDQHTLLYIKTKREMVYSNRPPGNWPAILQRRGLSKLPMRPDWRPIEGFSAYPLESLIWVNTLIRETSELHADLDEDGEYILDHWPEFNLLELDNILLKLCTMMFVRPESVQSLSTKSGYGRSTIIGLMNACYEMGLLITEDKLDASQLTRVSNDDEGMLGKIKDVFR